ncbi:MAG: hypothetical protein IAF02_12345 [Anaerolineae bacterium]|nr:hypothetical protein [Anaerolineae bacterium]
MEKRGSIIGGIILILLGVFFLLLQFFPGLADLFNLSQQWPLIIIGAGILFLLGALLGNPPLAVPGMIISGTGLILYYQNTSGDWGSWAYIWALYPVFIGVGIIIMHILQGAWRQGLREGGVLVLIGVVLFVVFAGFFNGFGGLGRFWPILIILGGLWLLWKSRGAAQGKANKEKELD